MHRGLCTNLSLAGLLFILLITLSGLYRADDTGEVVYYNEKGDWLYSRDSNISRTFVIITCKISDSIYSAQDRTSRVPEAEVNGIFSFTAERVEEMIRKGQIHERLVVDNVIEIFDPLVFQAMRAKIRDDEKGGESDHNNKEYGGLLYASGKIFYCDSGSYVPLCNDAQLAVNLPSRGVAEFHSHPSGCRGRSYPWACADSALAKKGNSCGHTQGPSLVDQQRVERRKGYVFGMRAKMVFIYDSTGVRATLPFSFFEEKNLVAPF